MDITEVAVAFSDASTENLDLSELASATLDWQSYTIIGMQSKLPTLEFNLDESKGVTIDEMNSSPTIRPQSPTGKCS